MDKLKYERELKDSGFKYICGVDEVGRGPRWGAGGWAGGIWARVDGLAGGGGR